MDTLWRTRIVISEIAPDGDGHAWWLVEQDRPDVVLQAGWAHEAVDAQSEARYAMQGWIYALNRVRG